MVYTGLDLLIAMKRVYFWFIVFINGIFHFLGTFLWDESQRAVDYTNWWTGEPSNGNGGTGGEDCVYMAKLKWFGWNDFHCNLHYNDDPFGEESGEIHALCMRK